MLWLPHQPITVHTVPGKQGKDSPAKLSKLLEQAVYSIDSLLMGCVGAY